MIELSEFHGSGFRFGDLILLRFYLQMLNDEMLKLKYEICFK